jgi:hypothetical protein
MKLKVLIVVKTYPQPAWRGIEVSCTQGVTEQGDWVRLFPVPFRLLEGRQQFKRYQWVEVEATKAKKDPRPESYHIDPDSIKILSEPVPTTNKWEARKELLYPLLSPSVESLEDTRKVNGASLGFVRPRVVEEFVIQPAAPDWTKEQKAKLAQQDFFYKRPSRLLEKVPFDFKYRFRCDDPRCKHSHIMKVNDWEVYQAYRNWRRKYGGDWEEKFRLRFGMEMIEKLDTHFFVGTLSRHPHRWTITGLFYPPR